MRTLIEMLLLGALIMGATMYSLIMWSGEVVMFYD